MHTSRGKRYAARSRRQKGIVSPRTSRARMRDSNNRFRSLMKGVRASAQPTQTRPTPIGDTANTSGLPVVEDEINVQAVDRPTTPLPTTQPAPPANYMTCRVESIHVQEGDRSTTPLPTTQPASPANHIASNKPPITSNSNSPLQQK